MDNGNKKNVVNNKEALKIWMPTQEWKPGTRYSDGTCEDYVKAINDMSKEFSKYISPPYKDIFDIADSEKFEVIRENIKGDSRFKDYNKAADKWRKNTPSAALTMYKKFLDSGAARRPLMLFSEARLEEELAQYKKDFSAWFEKGKYKWEAVATFQKYWDIDATDFDTMFKNSLSKTEDLLIPYLGSKAKEAIISFVETAPEEARAAFANLFKKDDNVIERIKEFKTKTSELYERYEIPNRNQPQNEYTITTFLWLRYPEDYYIYKENIVCTLAAKLCHIHSFRRSFKECYDEFYDLCSTICSYICRDRNFINIVNKKITDTCYADLNHKILTADFIYYIKQKDNDDDSYDGYWWLVSKPKIWKLSEWENGKVQDYTLKNDKGEPRQIQHNFPNVRMGNKVIGYEATPTKKIVAICEIAGEANNTDIKIKKIEDVTTDVPLEKLKTIPEIQNMEWFKNPNGSLFKVKESEYNCITKLIDGIYTPPEPYPGPEPEQKNDYKRNLIFFGAPGTGKSHDLNDLKDTFFEDYKGDYERVTFHPDYSYAHFVGTYKPVVPDTDQGKGEITYEYVPGPFMRMYVKAKTRPGERFLLIIEEINRANVAAVFGDVFQLLDRTKDGNSEYPVAASEDMKVYLKSKGVKDYDEVAIPPNMYIWATMNSADQGVFPMDTAFKRRWEFKYLGIDNGEDVMEGAEVPVYYQGKPMKWNDLRGKINNLLASPDINVNEDKQLGTFFINKEIIDNAMKDEETFKEIFKNKVLMYLFEDAAKHRRDKLFANKTNRYSEVCKIFDDYGLGVFAAYFEECKKAKEDSEAASGPAQENGQDHTDAPKGTIGEDN